MTCTCTYKSIARRFSGVPPPTGGGRRRAGPCGGVRLSAAAGCHHSLYTQDTTEKRLDLRCMQKGFARLFFGVPSTISPAAASGNVRLRAARRRRKVRPLPIDSN